MTGWKDLAFLGFFYLTTCIVRAVATAQAAENAVLARCFNFEHKADLLDFPRLSSQLDVRGIAWGNV